MVTTPCWMPQIGMEFSSLEKAWEFWVRYGGRVGFGVRKSYTNMSSLDGLATSSRFVCSNQGSRAEDKKFCVTKRNRAHTRTGCNVHMGITLVRENMTYKVHDLFLDHNHMLQTSETSRYIPSQRHISKHQAIEIDIADDSGIGPKAAHEFLGRHVGGSSNLGYTHRDHKNYLRTKRQRDMVYGELGSLLKYFQDKVTENPSFIYAMQMDCEEQIANIFWADAKMIVDYAHFGDVITFDTTFGTNKEYRPFGMFVGFNQFRETVVFGAALMYDETFESFEWLFNTFLSAHKQKQPRTIFTDQDIAMGKAIATVFTDAWHGLCTWHISQNALKHLRSTEEEEEDSSILSDFSSCMYEYEDKEEFEEKFNAMRRKVSKVNWLDSIYMLKEKWAECHMLDILTLGMRSTQLSESMNNALKGHLKSDLDIIRFLKRVEQVVEDKREKELQAEYQSRANFPTIMIMPPMLIQASKLYTPPLFKAFLCEYEKSLAAYTKDSFGCNEFVIAIGALGEDKIEEERTVIVNPTDQSVSCSCRLFERIGLLCRHALKGLDLVNIKTVPEKYILKRWTRGAKSGIIKDVHGRDIVENPKLVATRRYRDLCHLFLPLASRASDFEDCYMLLEEALHMLDKQVEEKIKESPSVVTEQPSVVPTPLNIPVKYAKARGLKKKPSRKGGIKRKRTWTEKYHKLKRNASKKNKTSETVLQEENVSVMTTSLASDMNMGTTAGENQEYESLISYTELLTSSNIVQDVNKPYSFEGIDWCPC